LALAVRAPSVHNTQPWRWVFGPAGLELYADRSRQLAAIDPDGRGLLVSCGAALYLAELGLAGQGWRVEVTRLPDPDQPDLLARLVPVERRAVDAETRLLAAAAARRRSERRPFGPDPVPAALLDELRLLAEHDGGYAHVVTRPDERLDLAVVVSWADQLELDDEAYRAELARWVQPAAAGEREGVPVSAVPRLSAGQERHTDVPLRDFEVGRRGDLPVPAVVDESPAWLVLFSTADDAVARLRAGERFAQVSVAAERLGLASSATTQAVDLPGVRARLRALMDWPDHPQMLLRVGWPPAGDPVPETPRRSVAEVLTVLEK
jgi:nitroreductase